jgi:hypothetical protein
MRLITGTPNKKLDAIFDKRLACENQKCELRDLSRGGSER